MKNAVLLLVSVIAAFGQVMSATVTAAGTGYTSAPTVTASAGGCTSQPTFTAAIDQNTHVLISVTPTFAGSGCTSGPTLAISGGGGSGATATASLLPYRIAILSSVNSATSGSVTPTLGTGSYTGFQFACYLLVPAQRVQFYPARLFVMPGTSQVSAQVSPPAGIVSALALGIVSEFVDSLTLPVGTATATVEAIIIQACSNQQTNIANWNPWAFYGTNSNGVTWNVVTIP